MRMYAGTWAGLHASGCITGRLYVYYVGGCVTISAGTCIGRAHLLAGARDLQTYQGRAAKYAYEWSEWVSGSVPGACLVCVSVCVGG